MYILHFFFMNSPINKNLSYFYHLPIVNTAAMSMGIQRCLQDSCLQILLCIQPKIKLLEHMPNFTFFLFFFAKHIYCFTQWLHQFIVSPTVYKGSTFSTSACAEIECLELLKSFSQCWFAILSFWLPLYVCSIQRVSHDFASHLVPNAFISYSLVGQQYGDRVLYSPTKTSVLGRPCKPGLHNWALQHFQPYSL